MRFVFSCLCFLSCSYFVLLGSGLSFAGGEGLAKEKTEAEGDRPLKALIWSAAKNLEVTRDLLTHQPLVFKTSGRVDEKHVGKKLEVSATFQPTATLLRNGNILAFAQGRLNSDSDKSAKVILMSRSVDNGKHWSDQKIISLPQMTYGYTAYTSEVNGQERVYVMYMVSVAETQAFLNANPSYQDKGPFYRALANNTYPNQSVTSLQRIVSDDGGDTWKEDFIHRAQDPSAGNVNSDAYRIVTFSPIGGISKLASGRWVISGVVRYSAEGLNKPTFRDYDGDSGSIVSDDLGLTWKMGAITVGSGGTESSADTLSDGRLLQIVRTQSDPVKYGIPWFTGKIRVSNRTKKHNLFVSSDEGNSWQFFSQTQWKHAQTLPSMLSTGSMIMYSLPSPRSSLTFSLPFVSHRTEGHLFYSRDNGQSWKKKLIEPASFSYSKLLFLPDSNQVLVLYTRLIHGYGGIKSKVIDLAELE